jgi:phage shock protein A
MPASDDLLHSIWAVLEHASRLERELRSTADEVAAWREVAQAALRALDREIARHREEDATRTTIA